jgi:hypothetical protein
MADASTQAPAWTPPWQGGGGDGSLSDAVSKLQAIAQNLGQQNNIAYRSNALAIGTTLAFNAIGTAATTVLSADTSAFPRTGILFHNPMSATAVIVSPSTLGATFTSPGGGWVILPYDYLPVAGAVAAFAWTAAVQAGTTGALTIATSPY